MHITTDVAGQTRVSHSRSPLGGVGLTGDNMSKRRWPRFQHDFIGDRLLMDWRLAGSWIHEIASGDDAGTAVETSTRAARVARDAKAERERKEKPPTVLPPTCDLRPGDFSIVLADVPDASVDVILTDPPYPAKNGERQPAGGQGGNTVLGLPSLADLNFTLKRAADTQALAGEAEAVRAWMATAKLVLPTRPARVLVDYCGDTRFYVGQVVDIDRWEKENLLVVNQGGQHAWGYPLDGVFE